MAKTSKQDNHSTKNGPPEMDWSHFQPLEVKVHNDFDRAFKIFRSMVQAERVLSIYKEKQEYEKPSQKRRRKHNESIQKSFEFEMKRKKIESGQFEKEKLKKQAQKEKRLREKAQSVNE